jgi:hypothetical protein
MCCRTGSGAQVVEHLPASIRPWVHTPVLPKQKKKDKEKQMLWSLFGSFLLVNILANIYIGSPTENSVLYW